MNLRLTDPQYQIAPRALPRGAAEPCCALGSDKTHPVLLILTFALLGVAQTFFAGYELGAGNQSIQIPFLKHAANAGLFNADPVVATARDYPSFFFRLLGQVVPADRVPEAYFALHLLTTFATFVALAALARSISGERLAAGALILMLLAGHHRALAGDTLYSNGFTHTYAVFPLAIAALALFYRGRVALAFAAAGLIFNLHALTGAYLLAMLLTWTAFECMARRMDWDRPVVFATLFILCALPTLAVMASQHQKFAGDWSRITAIRSADHSFPFEWWAVGAPDVPRFAMFVALAFIALSFVRDAVIRRKTSAITLACFALFAAGVVFSEVYAVPAVLRAQVFRASRLLMVVMFAHIAWGVVAAFRAELPRRWRALEIVTAIFVFATIALPPLAVFMPWALALAAFTAFVTGRLSVTQSIVASLSGLVTLAAWKTIAFPIPGLNDIKIIWPHITAPILAALVAAVLLACLSRVRLNLATRAVAVSAGIIAVVTLTRHLHGQVGAHTLSGDPWIRAQRWARDNTPRDAVFLTPLSPGGFRIHSDRAVAVEWRDGTQAYFSGDFARDWWKRVRAVNDKVMYDKAGRHKLFEGRDLETYDDEQLVALCNSPLTRATHIILPHADKPRTLPRIYQNSQYAIYLPVLKPREAPSDTPDKSRWEAQEKFVTDVCLPNIEKHRKGDIQISLVGEDGEPLADAPFVLNQTRHAFGFGASLPFFKKPNAPKIENFMPSGDVDPRELARFLEIFNFSQIPFSGKWGYIEPERGKRDYTDLEMYLAFCEKHKIETEFHFLSGYHPAWLRRVPRAEQARLFLEHARDLVTRYGKRIRHWQVVNEEMLLEYAPQVFKELRAIQPDISLGISHCSMFYNRDVHKMDMIRGRADVKWLRTQGAQVDYFAFHGHRPMGLWPDARDMYEALDTFAAENLKLHISEFTVPLNVPIVGPIRRGTWDAVLQAEFYERFYTVCFSHPAVESINMWGIGPITWQEGSGLLDENYDPKPAFEALKNLIQKRWKTQHSGTAGADGGIVTRGFHGDYEITVNLESGQTARGTFTLPRGQNLALGLKVQGGNLVRMDR